jgi:hypothetical protein
MNLVGKIVKLLDALWEDTGEKDELEPGFEVPVVHTTFDEEKYAGRLFEVLEYKGMCTYKDIETGEVLRSPVITMGRPYLVPVVVDPIDIVIHKSNKIKV